MSQLALPTPCYVGHCLLWKSARLQSRFAPLFPYLLNIRNVQTIVRAKVNFRLIRFIPGMGINMKLYLLVKKNPETLKMNESLQGISHTVLNLVHSWSPTPWHNTIQMKYRGSYWPSKGKKISWIQLWKLRGLMGEKLSSYQSEAENRTLLLHFFKLSMQPLILTAS